MALWLVAVCGDCRASMKLSWFHIWCPSPLPAPHMFLLKDLVLLEPNSKLSANLWNPKLKAAGTEVHWSVENKQPFLSLADFQAFQINPDGCCRLTRAEINGIVASGCAWRPPSLHEIILIPYDVHLHFLRFTCCFWKIWFLLEPNSKLSATYENGKKHPSHTSFLKPRD